MFLNEFTTQVLVIQGNEQMHRNIRTKKSSYLPKIKTNLYELKTAIRIKLYIKLENKYYNQEV